MNDTQRRDAMTLVDESLLERLQLGERDAFETVVRSHYEGVWRQQYLLCNDAELAADLTQETFLEAWRGIHAFRGKSSLRTWLYTIAARVWHRKVLLKRRETLPLTESLVAKEDPPEEITLRQFTQEAISRALLQVPDAVRAVLILHYRQEMTHAEIADALGLPLGTVKTRLYDGLRRLRRILSEEEAQ